MLSSFTSFGALKLWSRLKVHTRLLTLSTTLTLLIDRHKSLLFICHLTFLNIELFLSSKGLFLRHTWSTVIFFGVFYYSSNIYSRCFVLSGRYTAGCSRVRRTESFKHKNKFMTVTMSYKLASSWRPLFTLFTIQSSGSTHGLTTRPHGKSVMKLVNNVMVDVILAFW